VDIAGCGFLPTLSALTGSPAANSTSSAAAGGSGAAGAAAGNSSGAAASGSAGGKKGAGGKGGEGGNLDATPRALGVGFEGFNPRDANGVYSLNMAMPGEYQVAVELYKLAQEYGVDTWKVATLDGKPFSIKGVSRYCCSAAAIWAGAFSLGVCKRHGLMLHVETQTGTLLAWYSPVACICGTQGHYHIIMSHAAQQVRAHITSMWMPDVTAAISKRTACITACR